MNIQPFNELETDLIEGMEGFLELLKSGKPIPVRNVRYVTSPLVGGTWSKKLYETDSSAKLAEDSGYNSPPDAQICPRIDDQP